MCRTRMSNLSHFPSCPCRTSQSSQLTIGHHSSFRNVGHEGIHPIFKLSINSWHSSAPVFLAYKDVLCTLDLASCATVFRNSSTVYVADSAVTAISLRIRGVNSLVSISFCPITTTYGIFISSELRIFLPTDSLSLSIFIRRPRDA